MAARVDGGSRDLADAKFLVRRLGLQTAEEALSIVEEYYPRRLIAVRTQYFVEAVFEQLDANETDKDPP